MPLKIINSIFNIAKWDQFSSFLISKRKLQVCPFFQQQQKWSSSPVKMWSASGKNCIISLNLSIRVQMTCAITTQFSSYTMSITSKKMEWWGNDVDFNFILSRKVNFKCSDTLWCALKLGSFRKIQFK